MATYGNNPIYSGRAIPRNRKPMSRGGAAARLEEVGRQASQRIKRQRYNEKRRKSNGGMGG